MTTNIVRAKYPTNLDKVNTNSISPPDANKYFNNFFEIPVNVSSNIDAAVVAFFEQIADNKESAKALASAVIYTSIRQGLNPMETLQEFTKLPPGELNEYTTMFLNFERVGTSYLGVSNTPVVNTYIQRTILA